MKTPLEVAFLDVEKSAFVTDIIRQKLEKLEPLCAHMTSCRVTVDRDHGRAGCPPRATIEVRVPPGHCIVASETENEGATGLAAIVRAAFSVIRRRLVELVERQQERVKVHPEQEQQAVVERLFRAEGFGFLRTPDGRGLYFHRNSLLNASFDTLEEGALVRFTEEPGEKGPQAAGVQRVE